MNLESLRSTLAHAVTRYDRQQEDRAKRNRRASYNPYALGQYLARVDDIIQDVSAGTDPAAAIVAGFSGPLRTACLKAVGSRPDQSDSPATYLGMPVYRPISER